jgi:hypothetical protein
LDLSVVHDDDDDDDDAKRIPRDKYDIRQVPGSNLGWDTDSQAAQMRRKLEFKAGASA